MIFLPFKEVPSGIFFNKYNPERIQLIRSLPGFLGFYGRGIRKVKICNDGYCCSSLSPILIRFDNDENRTYAKLSI